MIIKISNRLIIIPISCLLLGCIGVLDLHQNNISNIFNYLIIGYILIILTICSTLSLIKENIIVVEEFFKFIYYNLLSFIIINLLLILFLIAVFISNDNINMLNLLITIFILLFSIFTSMYGIRKISVYKSQGYIEFD